LGATGIKEIPMKSFLVLAIAIAWSSSVCAADPAVCRPFARMLTDSVIRYVWVRAYTGCLNADETPTLPADGLPALKSVLPDAATPLPDATPPEIGSVPATDPADEAAPVPPARPSAPPKLSPHVCNRQSVSGYVAGSRDQAAWCRKNYRSFDAATGTVICARGDLKGKRDKCA
jgi:hypothetical protein